MDDNTEIMKNKLTNKIGDQTPEPTGAGKQTKTAISDNMFSNNILADEEEGYWSIVQRLPEVYFSLTPDGRISFLNPAFERITGWSCEDWIGKPFKNLIHPDDITYAEKSLFRFLNGEELSPVELTFLAKDGKYLIGEISAAFHNKDGKLLKIMGVVRDITDRKKTEEMLAVQEERIRSLYEISAEPGVCIDEQINETLKTGCNLLGLDIGVIGHIKGKIFTVLYCIGEMDAITVGLRLDLDKTYCSLTIAENDVIAFDNVGESQYKDHPCHVEFNLNSYLAVPLHVKGEVFGTINFSSPQPRAIPFTKADKEFIRLMGRWVSTMIERKQTEVMLIDKEELYRTLVENAHNLIIESKIDGSFLYLNSNHKNLLGYETGELLGKVVFDYIHADDCSHVLSEFMRALMTNTAAKIVFRFKHKNGEWRWLESTGKSFQTSSGESRWVIDSRDITERKSAEEQIQKSLREKESLLREIHHRVKNNLQVISSLLSLQSDYARESDSIKLFNESQNRISAIALIHEQLYQSEDLAEINMSSYISNLTGNLLTVYGDDGRSVEVEIDNIDISVDIDTAIPCGLIINELFSNCLKHAFNCRGKVPSEVASHIKVSFNTDMDGQYILCVADNGCGLPPGLDYRETETLGLQLVYTLTEQLRGEIELAADNGCRFDIRFPKAVNE